MTARMFQVSQFIAATCSLLPTYYLRSMSLHCLNTLIQNCGTAWSLSTKKARRLINAALNFFKPIMLAHSEHVKNYLTISITSNFLLVTWKIEIAPPLMSPLLSNATAPVKPSNCTFGIAAAIASRSAEPAILIASARA